MDDVVEAVGRLAPPADQPAPEATARQRARLVALIEAREQPLDPEPVGRRAVRQARSPAQRPGGRALRRWRSAALVTLAAAVTAAVVVTTRLGPEQRPSSRGGVATGVRVPRHWEPRVDGVALAAVRADRLHPTSIHGLETTASRALDSLSSPTVLARPSGSSRAFLVVVKGRSGWAGTKVGNRIVGFPVVLSLVVDGFGRLTAYSAGAPKSVPAGGQETALQRSATSVPSLPHIFGLLRYSFIGAPVVSGDGRTVSVLARDQCVGPPRLVGHLSTDRLVLYVTAPRAPPFAVCPTVIRFGPLHTRLRFPLDGRPIVNGITHRRVAYFAARNFVRVTVSPAGYRCGNPGPGTPFAAGSPVGATARCTASTLYPPPLGALGLAPVLVQQVDGSVGATGASPVVGRAAVRGHAAALAAASSGGTVHRRVVSWRAGGYSFVVASQLERAGQRVPSFAVLLSIAGGLVLPPS